MGGLTQLVASGPLLLAIPVAAAAGAVTFLSPCVLPLVPGYLSYVTGMAGLSGQTKEEPAMDRDAAALPSRSAVAILAKTATQGENPTTARALEPAQELPSRKSVAGSATRRHGPSALPQASRRRALAGATLFVLGFSALYASYGAALGSIGYVLDLHSVIVSQVLGGLIILMGLLFAGAFDRLTFSGRIARPNFRPRAGLAGAPLLGVLFGIGWTPCSGPTLSAVLALGASTGTAARSALLAFAYSLGVGIPFILVAVVFERGMRLFGFARKHGRMITKIGGALLIAVGLLEITGTWDTVIIWMKTI